MICANCKKQIYLSFGKSGSNGCYCEECAEKLGFFPKIATRPKNIQALTPVQHKVMHIHCDISKEFLNEYKAEIVNCLMEKVKERFKAYYSYGGNDVKSIIGQIAREVKDS